MATYGIASPKAAEVYFNNSLIGHGAGVRPAVAEPGGTLLDRLDAWFWRKEQEDREAYLARSRDIFDLEQRIKALDRGYPARYY